MTPADLTLARELVALDLLPPPDDHAGYRALTSLIGRVVRTEGGWAWFYDDETGAWLLDLADDLTRLGLLHLARKVWDCPFVTVGNHDGMTWAGDPPPGFWFATVGEHTFYGPAEHAALVAAIKAGAGR